MRKLLITLALFLTILFISSCATDSVVVYREYPSRPYYHHYYGPPYYTYHYPYTYHNHGYYHKPPKPHNNHPNSHQPALPPKPINTPRATVKPNNSGNGGSMSGRTTRPNTNSRRR